MRYATLDDFDGSFQFCRVVFRQASNGDGGDWSVDFPRADENLSIRLSELTKTPVGMDSDGMPKHLLISLTDPELFHCPFIMMTEVGSAYLDDERSGEPARLPAQGRIPLGRRLLGRSRLGFLREPDAEGAALGAAIRSSICRSTIRSFTR